jgi:tRNA-Thr(GGU) m(6)t(6)A37 methyltransferase TsaA
MEVFKYRSIGVIHSPFKEIKGMPIQPSSARGIDGWIEIFPPYLAGLEGLDGFSHVILLYHFHEVREMKLVVTPFLDHAPHGVFATRAPTRPNPIGLSVVELMSIENEVLFISNVDILDGTPLLDIKPFIPAFDHQQDVRTGWMKAGEDEIRTKVSDDRFEGTENREDGERFTGADPS